MTKNNMITWLKSNWFTSLLIIFVAAMVFIPNAKAWMLRQAISIGIFNADIDKKEGNKVNSVFQYADIAGKVTSSESLKGKVVFVNFWASWCPPCIAEMPSLTKLYEQFKNDDRIVFLFITQDNDPAKAVNYLNKQQFNLPVFTLTGSIHPEMYSGTLPTTFVLNKEGKMVFHHKGIAGYNTEKFIQQLKSLL